MSFEALMDDVITLIPSAQIRDKHAQVVDATPISGVQCKVTIKTEVKADGAGNQYSITHRIATYQKISSDDHVLLEDEATPRPVQMVESSALMGERMYRGYL